jgi:hypothetical protein
VVLTNIAFDGNFSALDGGGSSVGFVEIVDRLEPFKARDCGDRDELPTPLVEARRLAKLVEHDLPSRRDLNGQPPLDAAIGRATKLPHS